MTLHYREITLHPLVGKRVRIKQDKRITFGLRGRLGTVTKISEKQSEDEEGNITVLETDYVVALDRPYVFQDGHSTDTAAFTDETFFEVLSK